MGKLQVRTQTRQRRSLTILLLAAKDQERVTAVILAAGKSARMGRAKQLLPLGDSTVLAQTVENARRAHLDEIILVLGASAETIRCELSPFLTGDLKIVINQAYEEGMASSLRTGLSAVDSLSDAALIVLGDQPFIRPQTINHIVDEYRRSRPQIVIPLHQGIRGNPVLLDRSVFSEVMALQGDTGCRAIFGKHLVGIVDLEVEDIGVVLDIDDQQDYDRLSTRGQHPPRTDE